MPKLTYVDLLGGNLNARRHYTGLTHDVEGRLAKHNAGRVKHTAKFRPWRLEVAIGFESRERAAKFEQYLKSHSGRAFAARHF